MVNIEQLGWDPATAVELDHRRLRAPHVKLRSATEGPGGDVVYAIDLRITEPNRRFLPLTGMHSLEHFLLAGFQKHLPQHFISIGLMGCQTGFYLVLFNEGRAEIICRAYQRVLQDILDASGVPWDNDEQCGNARNHSLAQAQEIARQVLAGKDGWRQVV